VEGQLAYIVNHPTLADHRLYQSLAMTQLWDSTRGEAREQALAKLQANAAQLKVWADHCPANYLAKQLMVEAEIARVTQQDNAADLFDAAITAAHEGQYVQDEALANELAARHIMETRPRSRVGSMYLRDARYAYLIWGANRKVEELELEFPQLLTEYREARSVPAPAPGPFPTGTLVSQVTTQGSSTRRAGASRLDLDTLIKAGQTISGEVMLSRLLDRLLAIVIENAGAQRGVLVLARDGELYVQAEGSVTSDEISVLMSVPLDSTQGAALVPISVVRSAARTLEPVVIDDAQQDERFAADPYVLKRETRSVLCQPIVHQGQLAGLVYVENDLLSGVFTPERCHLLALLSGQIAVSLRNAELVERLEEKVRERTEQLELRSRFIEQTFGRYLSNEIADNLLRSAEALDFGGSKRLVTIMMSDLRGFSALSDRLPPESIVKLLNNYLSEMTAVIQKHNGTIDEFLGDAILTIFGAPLQRPDDADRAVACAVDMQLAMARVNAWNAEQGFPRLEMGIGINTGEVVVGNIGSRKRAKYGVVGSNVNLAGRIEGFATGGQILISEATRRAVKSPLTLRSEMHAEPKGTSLPTTLHEVGGLAGAFNLHLPERRAHWVAVEPAWQISFRWVSHKEVVGQEHEARLLQLSEGEAELASAEPPPAFTDLKLQVQGPDGALLGEAYAKVTTRPPRVGGFVVRFTLLSPAVQQALQTLLDRPG
jgi:class 3 adenylate cyclase